MLLWPVRLAQFLCCNARTCLAEFCCCCCCSCSYPPRVPSVTWGFRNGPPLLPIFCLPSSCFEREATLLQFSFHCSSPDHPWSASATLPWGVHDLSATLCIQSASIRRTCPSHLHFVSCTTIKSGSRLHDVNRSLLLISFNQKMHLMRCRHCSKFVFPNFLCCDGWVRLAEFCCCTKFVLRNLFVATRKFLSPNFVVVLSFS